MQGLKLTGKCPDFGALRRIAQVLAASSCFVGLNNADAQSRSAPTRQKPAIQQHLEALGNVVKLADSRGQGSREITLRWSQSAGTQIQAATKSSLQVKTQVTRKDPVPKQRSPEIAAGQLLVTVSDRQGIVRYVRVVSDPRITIAEYADASGTMNRKPDIVNNDVPLEVSVPANVDVSEIRIYKASYSADEKLLLTQLASSVVSGEIQ